MADATWDDMANGAVTLTKQPRKKGMKDKQLPPPETISLTPWGVAAMRAYAATPAAWNGKPMSVSALNKMLKRACRQAEVVLTERGVLPELIAPLSRMTVKALRHCFASTMQAAAPGLVGIDGKMIQDDGVRRALDHKSARTTAIYTQAAVDPVLREATRRLSFHLRQVFETPLPKVSALRLVSHG